MPQTRAWFNNKPVVLNARDRKLGPDGLRYEARLAYLDDRNARARELNRKADALEREIVRNKEASLCEGGARRSVVVSNPSASATDGAARCEARAGLEG